MLKRLMSCEFKLPNKFEHLHLDGTAESLQAPWLPLVAHELLCSFSVIGVCCAAVPVYLLCNLSLLYT